HFPRIIVLSLPCLIKGLAQYFVMLTKNSFLDEVRKQYVRRFWHQRTKVKDRQFLATTLHNTLRSLSSSQEQLSCHLGSAGHLFKNPF
ncbi:hypothetical protein O5833_27165, partial [Escherichia coli]|nr:hypothetical protein [Escherichia coli]